MKILGLTLTLIFSLNVFAEEAKSTLKAYSVPEMTCMACEAKIKKTMKKKFGVKDVSIDLDKKTVEFDCAGSEEACVDSAVIKAIQEEVGYSATKI